MVVPSHRARMVLGRILEGKSQAEVAARLRARPPSEEPMPPRVEATRDPTTRALDRRCRMLLEQGIATAELQGTDRDPSAEELAGNIENLVGFARIPVGVIGPLRINGTHAHGDFYVPLATTEGSLVASYNRGARLVSQAGGVTTVCLTESVSRAPCFEFGNVIEAGRFLSHAYERFDALQEVVSSQSRHCRLIDLKASLTGKDVHLIFEFTTGDASGQNMVTFATEAICRELLRDAPVQPAWWCLEANMSGDKKATMLAFTSTRGRKVVAEAVLPETLVSRDLRARPEDLVRCWQASILGGIQAGAMGVQGHYANAIAALFIACGQDVACVSEVSVGLTRLDLTRDGSLYVSVALPNLMVATVGGGTRLPTAAQSLDMIGCRGEGKARKFAEICCAVVLAGEVSICGALASGEFARAHAAYGRPRGEG